MPRPGSTHARGYGRAHQQLRRQWEPMVRTGRVVCPRCDQPIGRGQAWDLGHDDNDRRKYTGPEHAECNRSAGSAKAHSNRVDPAPKPRTRW